MKIETNLVPLVLEIPPKGVLRQSFKAEGRRSAGEEILAQAVYTLVFGVPAGVLSAWLYDQIKHHKNKSGFRFRINEKEATDFTEDSFKRTIEREIELERK